jgi:hypothetical protein
MKVLGEEQKPHQIVLTLEAQGGSTEEFYVQNNGEKLRVVAEGATLRGTALSVKFPEGSGYQRTTVTLRW